MRDKLGTINPNIDKDIIILTRFIEIFCIEKHPYEGKLGLESVETPNGGGNYDLPRLCPDCLELLEYSKMRRRLCAQDPKPICRKCKVHCYGEKYRGKIQEVMRFSGRRYAFEELRRGRIKELIQAISHLI
jgi:hypothetical protein